MTLGDYGDLGSRVSELVERGLEAYASGDLESAMSYWKHALALDPESVQARQYVGYVKRHFEMIDESPADAIAGSDSELEVPFGLAVLGPTRPFDFEDYHRKNAVDEIDESAPTRSYQAVAQPAELDRGWSVDGDLDVDELALTSEHKPVPRPTYEMLEDVGTGQLADLLEPEGDDPLEANKTQPLTTNDDLEEALAAVTEGLLIAEAGAIETDRPAPEPEAPPGRSTVFGYQPTIEPSEPQPESAVELEAEPAEPLELELDGLGRSGPPAPAPGPGALELDTTEPTAEVDHPASLDDLEVELEIEQPPAFEARDLSLDLGPAPEVEATPTPPELESEGLDLELGQAGAAPADSGVQISFRSPASSPPVTDEVTGGLQVQGSADLEEQLASLEAEMRTGPALDWQTHETAPVTDPAPPEPSTPSAIRADVDRGAAPGETTDDQLRRRIAGFIDRADAESRRDNLEAAAIAADMALSEGPDSAAAHKLVQQNRDMLVEVFRRYIGDLEGVPAVSLPMHEIPMQELDHRTAFLLSRIDGTLSFEDILDVSGMSRLDALRYLCRLRLQGILEVR